MTIDDQKKLVANFIRQPELAVVTSIWDGCPQAALVAFSRRHEFELIFGTSNTSRKCRNLRQNPETAVVIGLEGPITVQYEGTALETVDELKEECLGIHLEQNPESKKYTLLPDQTYFLIRPRWIRYSDISTEPEFVFELQF